MTPRQQAIIDLYKEGYTMRQIAMALGTKTHAYIQRTLKRFVPDIIRPMTYHPRYRRENPCRLRTLG